MMNDKKKILVGIFTLVSFLISFLMLYNDLMNYFIVFATITVILFIFLCVSIFKKQQSVEEIYEKNLDSILRKYDSIIVYSDTDYVVDEKTIVYVKNIEDLIKYCDETNKTIVYIKEENSSTFILKNEEELLVYIMKKEDNIKSLMEEKIDENINEEEEYVEDLPEDIDKTTIIKLKNNKLYKISPINNENE